jgi:hypothetical protein
MTSSINPEALKPGGRTWPETALRVVFGGVVFAAGLSGILLLAFPGSTSRTFAWGLQPEPLAALVGGFYLASAVTFAYALRQPWPTTRGLGVGVLALTIPPSPRRSCTSRPSTSAASWPSSGSSCSP